MFVLVGPNFAIGGTRLLGDALGALTAVFYAGYFLSIKVARDAGASTARLMYREERKSTPLPSGVQPWTPTPVGS